MTRKEELKKELGLIEEKELAGKIKELKNLEGTVENKLKIQDAIAHKWVMFGDFFIKLLVAVFVSAAFMYVVVTGHWDQMDDNGLIGSPSGGGNFQLLSVLGPLFGLVLSYYFGKSKASANGE